jgi:hypothetical protein
MKQYNFNPVLHQIHTEKKKRHKPKYLQNYAVHQQFILEEELSTLSIINKFTSKYSCHFFFNMNNFVDGPTNLKCVI